MGRWLLSELGNAAGAVTDVEFDETSGRDLAGHRDGPHRG